MNTTSIANRAKRLFTPVVFAAAVAAPAFADYRDDVANTPLQDINQPLERAYVLPPLSDHIIVAAAENDVAVNDQGSAARNDEMALSEDQAAVFDHATALNDDENDGTATQKLEQVIVVIVPDRSGAIDQQSASDDGTADQYDRGYYKDPETVAVAVVIVLNDDEAQDDGTAHQYDRGYYKDPEMVAVAVVTVLNDEEVQGD